MQKKYLFTSLVILFIVFVGSSVKADTFTQTIDFTNNTNPYWNSYDSTSYGKFIAEDYEVSGPDYDNDPFTYYHNINDLIDFGAGDTLDSADLVLYFKDVDRTGNSLSEYVRLSFDDGSWINLGETNTGETSDYDVTTILLDGILKVEIDLYSNSYNHEDIYLQYSTLSVAYTPECVVNPVPVPGAILLGIFGMGVSGLKLRKFA